jgi:hypothetical protein
VVFNGDRGSGPGIFARIKTGQQVPERAIGQETACIESRGSMYYRKRAFSGVLRRFGKSPKSTKRPCFPVFSRFFQSGRKSPKKA